jgi:hypothetical protein
VGDFQQNSGAMRGEIADLYLAVVFSRLKFESVARMERSEIRGL